MWRFLSRSFAVPVVHSNLTLLSRMCVASCDVMTMFYGLMWFDCTVLHSQFPLLTRLTCILWMCYNTLLLLRPSLTVTIQRHSHCALPTTQILLPLPPPPSLAVTLQLHVEAVPHTHAVGAQGGRTPLRHGNAICAHGCGRWGYQVGGCCLLLWEGRSLAELH